MTVVTFERTSEVILMEYGYCRISTNKQNIERQKRNILASYPNARLYEEIFTGRKKTGRKELEKILAKAGNGDTIIFDSVSRMSRNADEGVKLYMELYDKGVNLVFLKEPHINTDTYRMALAQTVQKVGDEIADTYIEATNKVFKILAKRQIRLAFEQSEKEVTDLQERTKEGLQTAKNNHKQIGNIKGTKLKVKKAIAAKEVIRKHSKAFGGTLDDKECMALAKVSRNSFYKYKKELLEEV